MISPPHAPTLCLLLHPPPLCHCPPPHSLTPLSLTHFLLLPLFLSNSLPPLSVTHCSPPSLAGLLSLSHCPPPRHSHCPLSLSLSSSLFLSLTSLIHCIFDIIEQHGEFPFLVSDDLNAGTGTANSNECVLPNSVLDMENDNEDAEWIWQTV